MRKKRKLVVNEGKKSRKVLLLEKNISLWQDTGLPSFEGGGGQNKWID